MKLNLPLFLRDTSNPFGYFCVNIEEFFMDSTRLVRKCTKPNKKEYQAIMYACSLGFLTMGFIGYFVKLFFIPVSNILVGMG
ncbi:protein transport protein SEC61 subunit gamma and related proteins [Babesia microti strain RI]|uniref:Protein transport protein SEC61 subunit gamma and related proteins n=2 Tax=Eukaryota TaxID=2759 RepID=A0A0K3AVC6_BABMR|nr:protein transport protein SEC61 subunit gamma and related proteins [Babesia microti strain RI]CTQ41556.1 protein transport protein SEC61 subunit gamma and related proteins [Babesia microti strain RI]|eukprot:XP_012649567.1 protein transport protein SEC61 subunit gamma and related proteins [Babesia microti strain RI]